MSYLPTHNLVSTMLVALLLSVLEVQASAHAFLVDSRVHDAPAISGQYSELTLRFSSPLELRLSSFFLQSLATPKSHVMAIGNPKRVYPQEQKMNLRSQNLTFQFSKLEPGIYHLIWNAFSIDGHRQEGRLRFAIGLVDRNAS